MAKKEHTYSNFGEYLYYAYANLQMLHYALKDGKPRYDRMCYMIRAKAFKAYKEGKWQIHDLFEFNITKIKENNYCWYCGKEMEPSKLTKDHVFPRAKGGDNNLDNIIMVCKECNSSKGKMDLFEWYATIRKEWPPINVLVHYMNIQYFSEIPQLTVDELLKVHSCGRKTVRDLQVYLSHFNLILGLTYGEIVSRLAEMPNTIMAQRSIGSHSVSMT